jgi:co-chaperonin GroES (HSP10)
VKNSTAVADLRAIVVEVGPAAWADEREPRARVGDKVLVSKHSGVMMIGTLDGKQYRVVNDNDIFAKITGEATHV